ncbi:MAG: PH domain-containing protein [Planctomycetota bacterium]
MPYDEPIASPAFEPRRTAIDGAQRLHPFSLLFSIGRAARNLLIPGLFVLFAADDNRYELFLMVLFVPATVRAMFKFLTFRYRFGETELIVTEGLIFRNERHVPYLRIQNIDWSQNVLHRVLGVANVRVETAGGSEPEAELQVLSVGAAEEMRGRVFEEKRRARGDEAVPAPQPAEERDELARLTLGELLLLGLLSNRGIALVAAGLGIGWEMGLFDPRQSEEWTGPVGAFLDRVPETWPWRLALLIAALLVFLLFVRMLSVVWTALQFWDFRLWRSEGGLRVESGLLTRHTSTIPFARVQQVTQIETWVQRLIGRRGLRVVTAGGDADNDEQSRRRWLLPLGERDLIDSLAGLAQPETSGTIAWQPVEPRAFLRLLRRAAILGLLILVIPALIWSRWWLVGAALVLPWAWLDAKLRVRRLGWAITGRGLHVRSGVWTHRVSAVRFNKIQTVQCETSPFDRRFGMATLAVDIAGSGNSDHRLRVPFLDATLAEMLRDRLTTEAAKTRFRW